MLVGGGREWHGMTGEGDDGGGIGQRLHFAACWLLDPRWRKRGYSEGRGGEGRGERAKGGRTWCMMRLQHPVRLAGRAISDEGAMPHDLDVTIASLQQGRPREALHVERAGWR
jgi:hypothetical protein